MLVALVCVAATAFGIYRPGYADDAHRVGNLSWDETKQRLGRLPTPREQYEAALLAAEEQLDALKQEYTQVYALYAEAFGQQA